MPDIVVTRVACNTTAGTQDITVTGFGTPVAAMFLMTHATADSTPVANAWLGYGATDGTRQWTVACSSADNSANTSDGSRQMTDQCISTVGVSGAVDSEAAFSAWITDGVRINWGVAPASAQFLVVVLFGGSIATARADTIDLGTSTSAQTYASMGFEADVLFTAGVMNLNIDSNIASHGLWMGFVHNAGGGTITQMNQSWVERNNQAAGIPHSRMMTDKFGAALLVTNGSVLHEYSASNFGASGFDFTSSANASSHRFHFLALDLGSLSAAVVQYDPPTSATTSTISASFTPQFNFLLMNACQAVDTTEADADAGSFAVSVSDEDDQYAFANSIEDAAATTNTASEADNAAVLMTDHTGAAMYAGTQTSFSGSGTNLSFSAANGTTRKWIALMIEGAAAPPAGNRRRRLLARAA